MAEEPIKTLVIGDARHGVEGPLIATTPEGHPNHVLVFISPILSIFVRCLRVFLQSILGGATGIQAVSATGIVTLPPLDFWMSVKVGAAIGLCSAFYCFCQNSVELLARIDQKLPQFRG